MKKKGKKLFEEAIASPAGKGVLEEIIESRTVKTTRDFVAITESLLKGVPELYISVVGIWSEEEERRSGLSHMQHKDDMMYKVPGRYLFALSTTKDGAKGALQSMRHYIAGDSRLRMRMSEELIMYLEMEGGPSLEYYSPTGRCERSPIVDLIYKHSITEFCEDEEFGGKYKQQEERISGTRWDPTFRGTMYEVGYVITKRGHISHGA